MNDRLWVALVALVIVCMVVLGGLGFRDCQDRRDQRAACMAIPSRTAAECIQAFPEMNR